MSSLVSAVMPAYNSAPYIEETIMSVLKQTYDNFELIIVDDFSTDDTYKIAKHWEERDPRIKVFRNKTNRGVADTSNYAISLASGKYIAKVDSDDICHKDRFLKQVEKFESINDLIICGTYIETFGSGKERIYRYPVTNKRIKARNIFAFAFANPSIMFRRDVVVKYGLNYDAKLDVCEDYDFVCRLLKFGSAHNIPEPLVRYRQHQDSLSRVKYENMNHASKLIRRREISEAGLKVTESDLETLSKLFDSKYFSKYSSNEIVDIERVFNEILSQLIEDKDDFYCIFKEEFRKTSIGMTLFNIPLYLRCCSGKYGCFDLRALARIIKNTIWR